MEIQEQIPKRNNPWLLIRGALTAAAAAAAALVTVWALGSLAHTGARDMRAEPGADWDLMERYDGCVSEAVANSLEGLEPVRWVWELDDGDLIAPEPDPACFGQTDDPATLGWLLDAARERLGVEETAFSLDTQIMAGTWVTYYLDDSILVITWKEIRDWAVYTVSEVQIAHASQFRRYVADGVYGTKSYYPTTEMAQTVNAVTASSGDFYLQRSWGVNVYMGQVCNVQKIVDSCFIDENGDLLFVRAGTLTTEEEAQRFVEENHVRFSLAFGPVMVEAGENVVPSLYPLGETNGHYARAALCQLGTLHYLLVAVNSEGGYVNMPTSGDFAEQLIALGAQKAYALDGGQTAAIVTNDTLINRPVRGFQRRISDIIYFATAIPEERWQEEQ